MEVRNRLNNATAPFTQQITMEGIELKILDNLILDDWANLRVPFIVSNEFMHMLFSICSDKSYTEILDRFWNIISR